MTSMKMLEYQRKYICTKCKYVMMVNAVYDLKNIIVAPKKCGNPEDCKGTNIISTKKLDAEFCKDYQEIKMQETVTKLAIGCMPNSMWVSLEDDLVDSCKPGDNITVCGIVKRRWGPLIPGKKIEIDLVIKANHIQVNNNYNTATSITPELKEMFQAFWQTYSERPLVARDIILKSICPQIFGLHLVKLAMAVVLAGGSHINDNSSTGVRVRTEPHLLLVGDPGTGKSELLRFASKIIPRSVLTTGVGSTAAGLTVTAIMENGEWQLEGGALVLSDGGICCIDEFNSMKERDRTSIHEAMEQQTISVAKAGIVCKLSTRCSILAATNPKGNIDPSQPLTMNIALASPLLSRFDLILLLRDKVNEKWDSLVADYILNSESNCSILTENIHCNVETLQAYFAVIKKIHPVLTEDSNKILSSYYQAQRRKNCRNKSRTTVRLLDSLVRLSQGHARLMLHQEVQVVDAVVAVMLVETSMEADASVFGLHFDVQSDFPDSPMKSYGELAETVLNKLELHDLLKNQRDAINEKISSNKPGPSSAGIESVQYRPESPYSHIKNQRKIDDTMIIKDNKREDDERENKRSEFDIRPINIQKIKRTKGKNTMSPKKIKLKDAKNDVFNDLAALNLMPGINDDFPGDVCDLDDIGVNLNFPKSVSIEENLDNTDHEQSELKTNDENKKIETTKNATEEISQRTRTKRVFSKFKFIPKDNQSKSDPDGDKNEEISKENRTNPKSSRSIFESENVEDITSVNSETIKEFPVCQSTSEKNQNSSQAPLQREENASELVEQVPQNKQSLNKFKFQKKENQSKADVHEISKLPHTLIFETQEELDNLDLDI